MSRRLSYKKCGVDIKGADAFVEGIKRFISSNTTNKVSAFGSLFALGPLLKQYKHPVLVSSTDGVGTKLKVAIDCGIHNTVGIDLVGMNVNDVICLGARPLFFLDYIACGKLHPRVLTSVVTGINRGLREAGCWLLGGETAEMPGMYKKGDYDLAGFCVGIADKDKIIDGSNIRAGDIVIGLPSNGLHSNGFSLVRKVFNSREIRQYAEELLKPTRIYVKTILSLLSASAEGGSASGGKRYPLNAIKGIAHVTGGAFYNKVTKILPAGVGMVINRNRWPVPRIFKVIQEQGGICDKEMYTVFNMGIGMIVVVDKKYLEAVASAGGKKDRFFVLGEIIRSPQKMALV